jgi:flagellar biosynthesis protein FlhG
MNNKLPLVFSLTSGKGGVGKTSVSVNLAICLAQMGKRVVLLDADLGLANVDIILGLSPKKNLFDLANGASLSDVLFKTPYEFSILPASSGENENLSTEQKYALLDSFSGMDDMLDYLIVDTGAGVGDNVKYFNIAVEERLVLLTNEPTSITDAYSLIKILYLRQQIKRFKLCVNMAPDEKRAKLIFKNISETCDKNNINVSLELSGIIPDDKEVRNAVISQRPFVVTNPNSPASLAVKELAKTVTSWPIHNNDGNIKFFFNKYLFQ